MKFICIHAFVEASYVHIFFYHFCNIQLSFMYSEFNVWQEMDRYKERCGSDKVPTYFFFKRQIRLVKQKNIYCMYSILYTSHIQYHNYKINKWTTPNGPHLAQSLNRRSDRQIPIQNLQHNTKNIYDSVTFNITIEIIDQRQYLIIPRKTRNKMLRHEVPRIKNKSLAIY